MPSQFQRVVILYAHPLFGEGIERMLRADPDLEVQLVRLDDAAAAECALSAAPDVVVLERTSPLQAIDLLHWAPSALFIDVGLDAGPSWTYRREALASEPNELLRAIHARHDGTPAAASETAAPAPAGGVPSRRMAPRRASVRVFADPNA